MSGCRRTHRLVGLGLAIGGGCKLQLAKIAAIAADDSSRRLRRASVAAMPIGLTWLFDLGFACWGKALFAAPPGQTLRKEESVWRIEPFSTFSPAALWGTERLFSTRVSFGFSGTVGLPIVHDVS